MCLALGDLWVMSPSRFCCANLIHYLRLHIGPLDTGKHAAFYRHGLCAVGCNGAEYYSRSMLGCHPEVIFVQ